MQTLSAFACAIIGIGTLLFGLYHTGLAVLAYAPLDGTYHAAMGLLFLVVGWTVLNIAAKGTSHA